MNFPKKNLAYSFFSTSTQLDGSKSITTSWFHAYLRSQFSEGSGTQNLGCFVFRKWQVKPGFFWCTYLIIFPKHSQKGKKYPKIRFGGTQSIITIWFSVHDSSFWYGSWGQAKPGISYASDSEKFWHICTYCWQRFYP